MLKIKANKGDMDIEVKGTVPELAADTLCIVQSIYQSLFEDSPMDAVMFRNMVLTGLNSKELDIFRYDYNKEGE